MDSHKNFYTIVHSSSIHNNLRWTWSPADAWINKMLHSHTTGLDSAIKE